MKIGDIIRDYCEQHGMSQRGFANKAGLSNTYIGLLVKGENARNGAAVQPSLPTIKKIADAMDCTVDVLLRKMQDEIVTVEDKEEDDLRSIPQIAIMGRGMEQLTPEQRTLVVDMMRPLFKSYFNVDLPTEDNV